MVGDDLREEIQIETLGPAISHYTDAVRFGDLLFISGLVAWDQHGNVVGKGDVVAQTEKIFLSMGQILAHGGCSELRQWRGGAQFQGAQQEGLRRAQVERGLGSSQTQ